MTHHLNRNYASLSMGSMPQLVHRILSKAFSSKRNSALPWQELSQDFMKLKPGLLRHYPNTSIQAAFREVTFHSLLVLLWMGINEKMYDVISFTSLLHLEKVFLTSSLSMWATMLGLLNQTYVHPPAYGVVHIRGTAWIDQYLENGA